MFRILLLFIVFLFTFTCLHAQVITRENADKKALKYFEEARSALNRSDKEGALEALEKSLSKEAGFIDARLMQADLMLQLKRYEKAEAAFESALKLAPDYAPLALFLLGEAEFQQQKYEQTIEHITSYLKKGKPNERRKRKAVKMIEDAKFAINALEHPVPFTPQSLGNAINTSQPEYLPSLTVNGQFLVYTSRADGRQEDIFFSERSDTGWQTGQPLEALNSPYNDSSPSIAANGKAMAFARDTRDGNFDLYFAEKANGEWQTAKRIPPPVSTSRWESQPSLSADGQYLIFASDRAGGEGQLDLWISFRKPDGNWGTPENLGSTINTPLNEQAPFIHPDGQSLYFMSKGHPGMGEYDLFVSRVDQKGKWSTPQNLGYPINTQYNEGALAISLDGVTAYFDTDKFGPTGKYQEMGNADLFSFELPEQVRPKAVTYVQASVMDAVTKKPLIADISFIRLRDNQPHLNAQTDEEGQFLTVLRLGEDYALNVSKAGYLFQSENFALSSLSSIDQPFILEIYLNPIPREVLPNAGKPIVLKNIFFNTGSAELLPSSLTELQQLNQLLVDNPELKIQINGHTDNVGSPEDNQVLSKDRAKAVHDYLIEQGIPPARLRYKGYGETRPVKGNDTSEGRQLNRRTEFEVVGNKL